MYYTNKEIFVLSAVGCMDTERDGLESILAGNDEGDAAFGIKTAGETLAQKELG